MNAKAFRIVLLTILALSAAGAAARAAWVEDGVEVGPYLFPLVSNEDIAAVPDGAGGSIIAWIDARNGYENVYVQRTGPGGGSLWTPGGVPVCYSEWMQWGASIASDGAGGAIVAWSEDRGSYADIYVQRIDYAGTAMWGEGGIAICSAPNVQNNPQIVTDGSGGAIVVWSDGRDEYYDIYAQGVSSSGAARWTADGIPICTVAGTQNNPRIVSDGDGGAIIAWADDRGADYDIYAQYVSSTGALKWAVNGVAVCAATGGQFYPELACDIWNGAIVTWQDSRNGNKDIYAQRVNSKGAVSWTANGVPLCTASGDQSYPKIVSDGSEGAIVSWTDARTDYNIYAQYVDVSGAVQWTYDGLPVCTESGSQSGCSIVSDGSGGAVMAWQDNRDGNADIYAQRVNPFGLSLWTAGGEPVCTSYYDQFGVRIVSNGAGGAVAAWIDARENELESFDVYAQEIDDSGATLWMMFGVPVCAHFKGYGNPEIMSDGAGGAIVTWTELRNGIDWDIYVQLLSASGDLLWGDGVPLCTEWGYQRGNVIESDGAGGAIVAWYDFRSGNYDIYAQRVDASGSARWAAGGTPLCAAALDQQLPQIVSDGIGGSIVAWQDARSANLDIYAQRVDSLGTPQWTTDGVPVCTLAGIQQYPRVAPDGSGGAIVVWQDNRNGNYDLYSQRLDPSGTELWTAGGVAVCISSSSQSDPWIVTDGSGGAIVTWVDGGVGVNAIYAQRVDASGTVMWAAGGVPVCASLEYQTTPRIISDGSGGAIVTWTDYRNYNNDIYAQRVDASGTGLWTAEGVAVCTAMQTQVNPRITSDGASGAIVTWEDWRYSNYDIYAQRIDAYGSPRWTAGGVPACTDPGSQTGPAITTDGAAGALVAWNDARTTGGGAGIYALRATDIGLGPICEVYPEHIEIPGPVETGTYADTSFTITNIGLGTLVGYVDESCDQLDILSGGGSYGLTNGQSLVVTVRFQPSEEGAYECEVETGMYLCSDVTVAGDAYACPPDSVLYVDAGAIGADDGTSWADAFVDLQDAIERSALCGGVTQIWVAEGVYYPSDVGTRTESFQLREGLAILGGFAGTETSAGERDLAHHATILSGDIGSPGYAGDNSLHVVTVFGTDNTAVLDGVTIRDGNADIAPTSGGGLYSYGGDPTIRNVIFTCNSAATLGGGMSNGRGDPRLVNVVFLRNSAGDYGGGMANYGGSPLMVNCSFFGNRADDGGGGLFNDTASNPEIYNAVMWGDSTLDMVLPEIENINSSVPVISSSLIMGCGTSGAGWQADYGTDGGGNLDRDADFVDMDSGDLHLLGDSPAVDAGNGSAPGLIATDIEGNPRIQGIAIDMGAYEGEYSLVSVEVDTDPSGLDITIDGEALTSPYGFYARSGSRHDIGTSTPQIQGEIYYSFNGWSDSGAIEHEITVPLEEVSYTAYFTWAYTCAFIDSIMDVPDDQGGWVRVYFRRSHYDDASEAVYPIASYNIHRRVDDPELAAMILEEGKAAGPAYLEYDGRFFIIPDSAPQTAPPGIWEVVGTVAAAQQEYYICLAPTLADSSETTPYSAFYISAHSTTPSVYFDSPPDSGYSVDNIAPGVPLGLSVAYNTGSGNILTWDSSPEEDFQYYRVYRGGTEDFMPGPGNLVHQTATPGWTDPEYDGWDVYYKVTALDHAGNESAPASPEEVTGGDAPGIPDAFALYQNVPNPFNPTTSIRFDLPRPTHVSLVVYNVKGEAVARIYDGQMTAGRKELTWNALDGRGRPVSSGIYFYRLSAGGFVQTRKMVLLR